MAQSIERRDTSQFGVAIFTWATSPGGLYNLGNALGLVSGLTLAILPVSLSVTGDSQAVAGAVVAYLAGDGAAVALTCAMLVFFFSGIQYDRAWAKGAPPDPAFNRSGDVWSGIGALLLGVGLLSLGQPVLAATAGLLHAIGKFGSAWFSGLKLPFWKDSWSDVWRTTVLISRFPAIVAAVLALVSDFETQMGMDVVVAIAPSSTLLVCYFLWVWADLKLYKS